MTTTKRSLDQCYRLDDLPPLNYWRYEHGLNLAAATFLDYFLSQLGVNTTARGEEYWEFDEQFSWEYGSGISGENGSEWERAKAELVESEKPDANYLSFFSEADDSVDCITFIRPTAELMEVFGLTLETYDIVARLDTVISCRPDSWMRLADTVRPDEIFALELWISRGGLASVANAEELENLVRIYHGAAPRH
jgi:hypothetical protein